MKKLLLGAAIGLAAFAITSCHSGTNQSGTTANTDTNKSLKPAAKMQLAAAPGPGTFALDGTPYATAESEIKTSFINGGQTSPGHEGNYDHSHHTCIWYCKDAWQKMSDIASQVPNADGVRFYFAKDSDGNYTAIPVVTTQGPAYSNSESGFSHQDFFFASDPQIPNCGVPGGPVGHTGETKPSQGATMYSPTPNFGTLTPCPPNQSPHYLSAAAAYEMIYKNCGRPGVSNKFNSVSEWFDIGVITSLAANIPTDGGVRLYYARHTNPGPHDNNVARHGLVMVLTKPAGTYQLDYFTCITFSGMHYHHLLPHDPGDGATDNGEECPTNCIGGVWSDPTIVP